MAIHHAKHQSDFPGLTPAQYEALADAFLQRPSSSSFKECNRKRGDFLRYDMVTGEFAVLSNNGVIRTYFKPVPCATLPPSARVRCHGYSSNLDYFNAECRRERQ